MPGHEQRVRDEFTRQSETFSSSPAITDKVLAQRIIDALGDDAKGSVLDVACGPGVLSAAIAETAREVVAFDLTPAMLAKAAQRCAAAGRGNVSFREGNAAYMPFADAAFDGAVTRLAIHHFTSRRASPGKSSACFGRTARWSSPTSSALRTRSKRIAERHRNPARSVAYAHAAGGELVSQVEGAGFAVETRSAWDKPREFDEWMGIVNDPVRVPPLRAVVRALAQAGKPAEWDCRPTAARSILSPLASDSGTEAGRSRLAHVRRSGIRFADKDMRQQNNLQRIRRRYAARTMSRISPSVSSIMAAVTSRWVQARIRPSIMASSTPFCRNAATIFSPSTPAPAGLKNTRLVSGCCTSTPASCDSPRASARALAWSSLRRSTWWSRA